MARRGSVPHDKVVAETHGGSAARVVRQLQPSRGGASAPVLEAVGSGSSDSAGASEGPKTSRMGGLGEMPLGVIFQCDTGSFIKFGLLRLRTLKDVKALDY